jgi:AcrR family transcriptional regulator
MPKIRADNIDEHKAQTRAALLEAAYVLMAGGGYDAMRREDVAALAGVARTTVYSYFATNEDLVVAVAEDRAESILSAVLEPAASSCDDPVTAILSLVQGCLEYAAEHPADAELFLSVARTMSSETSDKIWLLLGRVPVEIDRLVCLGVGSGSIQGENREGLVLAIGELLMGGVDQLLRADDSEAALGEIVCTRTAIIRRLVEG